MGVKIWSPVDTPSATSNIAHTLNLAFLSPHTISQPLHLGRAPAFIRSSEYSGRQSRQRRRETRRMRCGSGWIGCRRRKKGGREVAPTGSRRGYWRRSAFRCGSRPATPPPTPATSSPGDRPRPPLPRSRPLLRPMTRLPRPLLLRRATPPPVPMLLLRPTTPPPAPDLPRTACRPFSSSPSKQWKRGRER